MLFSSTDTFSHGSFLAAPDRQVGPPASAARGSSPVCRWVHAAGYDFAYIEEGEGEPLLFIHGSLGTLLDFTPAVQHFAPGYRAIAYSRRFHPPNITDRSSTQYTLARHADDLDAVLHALHIESPHIVGSSWGAYVALFLALHQPDLIHSLVLGEPPILPLLQRSQVGRNLLDQFQRETIQPSLASLRRGDGEDGVRRFVDGVTGRSGNFDALPGDAREKLLLSAEELRREFETPLGEYMPDLTTDALNALTLPVLLLGGERSPKMFRLITDELDLAIPEAERVVVPRAGHTLHSGNPEVYFGVVGQFLRRHGRGHHPPHSR